MKKNSTMWSRRLRNSRKNRSKISLINSCWCSWFIRTIRSKSNIWI